MNAYKTRLVLCSLQVLHTSSLVVRAPLPTTRREFTALCTRSWFCVCYYEKLRTFYVYWYNGSAINMFTLLRLCIYLYFKTVEIKKKKKQKTTRQAHNITRLTTVTTISCAAVMESTNRLYCDGLNVNSCTTILRV